MGRLDVLLVNPPFVDDFCRCQRWPARTRGRALRPPDWLMYSAAVLRADGCQATVLDCIADSIDLDALARVVERRRPAAVVVDTSTPSIAADVACARRCKEAGARMTVLVGTHATALPEEVLSDGAGAVDVVALGEYDHTIRDLMRAGGALADVPGICFVDHDTPRRTEPRPLIHDLDALPFPACPEVDPHKYFDAGRLHPHVNIIGGRGCPFGCTFCQWPQLMFGHRYRFRSPQNIADEIEYTLGLWPSLSHGEFFFEDDTFTVNKKRALAICEELGRRRLDITWSANARPDIYDAELFATMKRRGCRQLLVGFESGVQQILDNVKKAYKVEHAPRFVRAAQKAGIAVHGCFVLGLPGETLQTARQTIEFALSLNLDTIQFSAAVPLPGSAYFDYCKENGLLRAKDWSDWLQDDEQGAVVDYPDITAEQIDHLVDRGLKRFYFRPRWLLNFLLRHHNRWDLYRKLRGGYNFASYLLGR